MIIPIPPEVYLQRRGYLHGCHYDIMETTTKLGDIYIVHNILKDIPSLSIIGWWCPNEEIILSIYKQLIQSSSVISSPIQLQQDADIWLKLFNDGIKIEQVTSSYPHVYVSITSTDQLISCWEYKENILSSNSMPSNLLIIK